MKSTASDGDDNEDVKGVKGEMGSWLHSSPKKKIGAIGALSLLSPLLLNPTPTNAAVSTPSPKPSLIKKLKTGSTALSPASSSHALKKSSHVPVFMVCTSWGSPYMVYGSAGQPTALYFLDPKDAFQMSQEFLQLMPEGGNTVHVMCTSMERAMRHATGRDLPTGSIGEDGKVEVMEYRIVGGNRDIHTSKTKYGFECGVPLFGVEGLKTKRGEALLFFSHDDLMDAWRDNEGGKNGEVEPEVEVFDFVEVVKAMDRSEGEGFDA